MGKNYGKTNFALAAGQGNEEGIKLNQKLYSRRIEQLSVIVDDKNYMDSIGGLTSNSNYISFIHNMYLALISGRKITSNMKSAITNIVRSYAKHLKEKNDPALQQQKLEYINKVDSVKRKLNECNYTKGYTYERLHFLESIETYIRNRGKLSPNQMKALNKMNNQYDKKLEKIKKREIVK